MNNIITVMQNYFSRMNIGRRSQELYALKDKECEAMIAALANGEQPEHVIRTVFNYGFAKGWSSHSRRKKRRA